MFDTYTLMLIISMHELKNSLTVVVINCFCSSQGGGGEGAIDLLEDKDVWLSGVRRSCLFTVSDIGLFCILLQL